MDNSKMRLRSTVTLEERKAANKKTKVLKAEDLPYIKFPGSIRYYNDKIDCAMICDDLLKHAMKSTSLFALGFDMEWPFNFKTGSGKTAVIQISPDLKMCIILQVSALKNLPKALTELIVHPNVRLCGVNVKNDVRKLWRDFKCFDVNSAINNCIDCGVYANSVLTNHSSRWSLDRLTNFMLKMRINKDNKVRMSRWADSPLSKHQLEYAATDAYVSLKLYMEITKLKDIADEKESLPVLLA